MIHRSWKPIFEQYDFDLHDIYQGEVYPPKDDLFRVFQLPVEEIRIVLLGQDPYHGPGQAHGYSFSVPDGVPIPPSLQNIYKELQQCFPERKYTFPSGNLEQWVLREKIFLCNASLTVEKGKPGSHMEIWKEFTDEVIQYIDKMNPTCVFLLLGNFAKSKEALIQRKNRIVTEVHPSPLARTFVGSRVFQRVEKVLGQEVNWSIGKNIIYVPCDPLLFGSSMFPITINSGEEIVQKEPKEKKKQTRLQRICESPETVQEDAVKAYVEYSKSNNLEIKVEDINELLSS
jgi:uracil-DNA glycosylase